MSQAFHMKLDFSHQDSREAAKARSFKVTKQHWLWCNFGWFCCMTVSVTRHQCTAMIPLLIQRI